MSLTHPLFALGRPHRPYKVSRLPADGHMPYEALARVHYLFLLAKGIAVHL